MPTFTREEWLVEHSKRIGGSAAPKVLGVSKYGTAFDVYMEIVEGVRPDTTDAMRRGLELEPLVIYLYGQETGHETMPGTFLVSDEHEFMSATLDLFDKTEGCNVQCKTSDKYVRESWGDPARHDDTLPADVFIQVQHEMAVCGADMTRVPVLIASKDGFDALRAMLKVQVPMDIVAQQALNLGEFLIFPVARNDKIITQMIADEKTFWEDHVLARNPPAHSSVPQERDTIRDPTETELELLERARPVYRQFKLAEARRDDIKAELAQAIGKDTGIADPSGGKVTWKAPPEKETTVTTINWKGLAEWTCVFLGIPTTKWKEKVEEFTTEETVKKQPPRVLRVPRQWGRE